MVSLESRSLLDAQQRCYSERAPTYEDWRLRTGEFDQGDAANEVWRREVDQRALWLENMGQIGTVLELAAGTGLRTQRLVSQADFGVRDLLAEIERNLPIRLPSIVEGLDP